MTAKFRLLITILALLSEALAFAGPQATCPAKTVQDLTAMNRDQRTMFFESYLRNNLKMSSASKYLEEDCLETYLKLGVDLNLHTEALGDAQISAIAMARTSNEAKVLMAHGADPNWLSPSGYGILNRAAAGFSLEEFKYWESQVQYKIPDPILNPKQLLVSALDSGTNEIAKYLIQKGVDPWGANAIIGAARRENIELVKLFLSKLKLPEHQSLLNEAFYRRVVEPYKTAPARDKEILRLMIAAGADINAINESSDMTPLEAAILVAGDQKTAMLLIELGADVKIADKNAFDSKGVKHVTSKGLLASVIRNSDSTLLKLLLKGGADLKSTSVMHDSTLGLAIQAGNLSLVQTLLDHKFPPNGFQDDPEPPLITAAIEGSLPILKLLVERGADLKAAKFKKGSALDWAVNAGNIEIVKFLLDHGARINHDDQSGINLLAFLVDRSCDAKMLSYLLSLPIASTDALKQSELFHAALPARQFCSPEALKLLLKAGVPIDRKNSAGLTALQSAVSTNHINAANLLVSLGADIDIKDNAGRSLKELKPEGRTLEKDWLEKLFAINHWIKWSADPKQSVDDEELKTALRTFASGNKKLPALPKHASQNLKDFYLTLNDGLTKPRTAPWEITAKPLDIEGMPIDYYRAILIAGKSTEARQQHKFKPTAEQAKTILKRMVADGNATNEDYELMSWLISVSGMPLDLETLNLFSFDTNAIKHDVDEMVKTKPLEYKGAPTLAAIKLAKALLAHGDADFECNSPEHSEGMRPAASNQSVADILNWLAVYGDNPAADRSLVAKIARMVLETKKVCDQDRDFLLRAMRGWGRMAAPAHHETTCSILSSVKSRPMNERPLQELLLITQSIGLRSDLSEAAWLEQIKAFAETHPDATKPFGDNLMQVYLGLLRYTLGNPSAIQKSDSNQVKIQASDAKRGTIAKLCRIMRSDNPEVAAAGKVWIETLKTDLDHPRRWPAGIEIETSASADTTLAQEFEAAKLNEDLKMLRSDCAELPTPLTKVEPGKAKASASAKPKSASQKSYDFEPRSRVK